MRNWHRFFTHWQNWVGLLIVLVFIFVAISAPILSPQEKNDPVGIKYAGNKLEVEPQPPSQEAPLGTLTNQASVYHSLVWGTRSAIFFGLVVALISMMIGVIIGTVSAYSGGFLNDLLLRITDSFLAFPIIAAIVVIAQLLTIILNNAGVAYTAGGMGGVTTTGSSLFNAPDYMPLWLYWMEQADPVLIAMILFSWMPSARLMNTTVTREMEQEYILAARSIGVNSRRVIFKHLMPNAISPVIVLAARDVGGMVLLQTTFNFIGLGKNSPWGMILLNAKDWVISPGGGILAYWWVFLPVTLALILFGIGWNLLGDGLNDLLNVKAS